MKRDTDTGILTSVRYVCLSQVGNVSKTTVTLTCVSYSAQRFFIFS